MNNAGLAFQLFGSIVFLYGFSKTWRDWEGVGFWDFATVPAARAVQRFQAAVTRAMGRSTPTMHAHAAGAATVTGSLTMEAEIEARLPSDPAVAIIELDQRIRKLRRAVTEIDQAHRNASVALRQDLAGLDERLTDTSNRLDDLTKRLALEGLRAQAFGVSLVLVGVLLQGVAAAVFPI